METARYMCQRLAPFFVFFLIIGFATRVALSLYNPADVEGGGFDMLQAFLVGLYFDIGTFAYFAIPLILAALAIPARVQGTKTDNRITAFVFFLFAYVMVFTAAGEWFFWDEFQSRYNFIAVDYLVYTHEVIGNIRESYPVFPIMAAIAVFTGLLAWAVYKILPRFSPLGVTLGRRLGAFALVIILAVTSNLVWRSEQASVSDNRYINELAHNGVYELFNAYSHNELTYEDFYITRPEAEIREFIAAKTGGNAQAESPLSHTVKARAAKKQYNLVVITVESLGANFLTRFGSTTNITPNLDKLVDKSMFFSNLYATGTRTVYGLAALTLASPPIPGNSIVRRHDNGGLATIGDVLRKQGYSTKFIYGGFGYFDNMNAFFDANGYEVVDRNNLSKEEINFANIWGVADDDLFRRVLKENDKAHAEGKPFFDMVMTTSNHRPYTYPEGKIDLPPKSGRRGGVKYSDFAIDEFLREAAKKPWFKDTIFVIVADHTAGSSGKSQLDPTKYHIPMWVYAPGIIKPRIVDTMMSQIDVVPTVLGLMNVSYESKFFGRDIMKEKPGRVFISNYQQLGYMTDKGLVILSPVNKADFYKRDASGQYVRQDNVPQDILNEAIGYYQSAAQWRSWSKKAE
ncbi:MAG: sulfatase [Micavibrio aeruginosavorus]|uniref:Sulfatase n=1 Tax=Micavibrio aeruginosavorus TaxID=349221 RepID=A0A2W5A5M2_9BACT|nr:MAG: sulfatase [Micavibrio aeruginosavorus]